MVEEDSAVQSADGSSDHSVKAKETLPYGAIVHGAQAHAELITARFPQVCSYSSWKLKNEERTSHLQFESPMN